MIYRGTGLTGKLQLLRRLPFTWDKENARERLVRKDGEVTLHHALSDGTAGCKEGEQDDCQMSDSVNHRKDTITNLRP